MAYLRLPDNSYFKIPEGSSAQEAYALAQKKYPEAFKAPETRDTGFTGAFKSSVESLKGDIGALAGKVGLMDEEAAQKYVEEKKRAAEEKFKPTEEGWSEAPLTKFKELLGGSLPYMAAPVAAGAAVAAAPITGTAATVAGLGAAGLASAAQFTGSNLQRQMEEGKTLKETSLGSAAAAAVPMAALDTLSLKMIPGIGRIFGQAGIKITPDVAQQIAKQGTLQTMKAYGVQGLKTAGIEGATEAGQQFFERLQAGLDIADPEARKEYFESFIGGAVLGGTLAVPGTALERRRATAGVRQEQKEADEKAIAEERARLEEEAAAAEMAKLQQKTGSVIGEEAAGKAEALKPKLTKTGEYTDAEGNKVPEYSATGLPTTTVAEREQAAEEAQVPEYAKALRERDQLKSLVDSTSAQLDVAIESGDTKAYKDLAPQLENARVALGEANKQLRKLSKTGAVEDRATLEEQLATLQRDFKKYTGAAFDKDKLDKIADKIDATKAKLDELAKAERVQPGFDFEAGAREDAEAAQVAKVEELLSPKETAPLATEEDIAAYKAYNAKVNLLTQERKRLEGLFNVANNANDIRGAMDLRKLIAKKDEEIEAAKQEMPGAKQEPAKIKKELSLVEEGRAIQRLRDQLKNDDDEIKTANPDDFFNTKGEVTPYGKHLAGVQQRRDKLAAEIESRQAAFDERNRAEGAEAALTGQIERAFPEKETKAPADVDVIGSMAALRQQIGTGISLRGELMGLRRKLQEARAARNKMGKGVDREAVSAIINRMRSITEQIADQDSVSADLPIPAKLPERTKKYFKALNAARAKQREAIANYMDALEALANRDYIGGVTKKAKVTKQVLEKRIADAEVLFANRMLEEVAIHRRVLGALPLTEKREEAFRNQYVQALQDVKKLAEGTLAAPEAARSVIAEQISDITYAASQERGQKTKVSPLLKTQFPSAEQETDADRLAALKQQRERIESFDAAPLGQATDEVAKGIDKDIARMQEKTPDVSNVGVPEQGDLFAPKELAPIATKRATHKNFMRFVSIQASKFKQSLREAEAAIAKAKGPVTSLPERIKAYRLRIGEYNKIVREVTANATEEARAAAQAEVKSKATALRKQALAIQDALYSDQIAGLEKSLKTLKSDLRFFKRSVAKMKDSKTQHAANRKIAEIEKNIDSINNQLSSIYESYEAALEDAPIKEENRLFEQYMKADPVLASVKSTMERKRATLNTMLEEHDANLEKAASERRLAEPKEEMIEVTPEERAQEQRLLEGLGLGGVKLVEGKLQPVLSAAEKAEQAQKDIAAEARRSTAYSKARAERKRQMAEVRAKEAAERKGYEKDINKLRDEYEALDPVKDAEKRLAILKEAEPLYKRYRALTPIERIAADEGSKRAKGPATKDVTPPQFKTGVKKAPKTRVEAQNKFEAEIAEGLASERDFDYSDTGLSTAAFDDIVSQIGEAKYRSEEVVGKGLTGDQAKSIIAKVKLPKGLNLVVLDKLNLGLAARIQAQGVNPDTVRGGVLPDGTVFIVANTHADPKDLAKTLAHEITGHLGVEGTLGEAGMNALIKKIGGKEAVMKLADALGVGEDAGAAYAAAKRIGRTEEQALGMAVREMIAHTEEARIDKNFLAKAGEFIKAMVGAVRAALRKMGVDLDISTSDIFKILRDARKDFDAVTPGAYVNKDGDILFNSKPVFNAKFQAVADMTKDLVYRQKPIRDRVLGELTGLIFQTKYIDRFAPVMKVLEKAKDSLKATQLMYYLRMHDQRMAWTSQIASAGPAILKKVPRKGGGEEFLIETDKGATLKDVAAALREANVGNHEATVEMFTKYLIAKRAKTVGLAAVNYTGKITQKMLNEVEAAVKSDQKTKDAFEKAEKIYGEYNKGLINFAVQTGAVSKADAAEMLRAGNYVPFYRVNKDNVVLLEIGGAPPIKIGNLQEQPYLHELVSGEQPIYDMFTSALQNTAMLTDMSLRNLATRNVAYTLADMGLLERRSTSPKDSGVYTGPGKLDAKTIRFKKDGVDMYAVVDTAATGVEAELLVKGLQGVNTSLPNAVKMLNVPANLLRKWVTRNPAYALRQVVRDPLNAVMVSGADTIPVVSSLKEIGKMVAGKSMGEQLLQSRGILGGQVLTGTTEDQRQIMLQIASGKKGWDYYMAKADQLAIQGDAATRVVMYNSFIKQGLSEMEATLATLEAMNFSKRGISPSLFALSTMVPFMNAQIQGLNVLYQAFTGKMPFNEKLKVKQKLIQRGLMMMGFTMIYAALMSDDEAYANANMEERYGNWFVYVPFADEPIKVPIPFELGWLFKAAPEGVMNLLSRDDKARDVAGALGKMAWQSVPISMPQGIKPALELALNQSFYTGRAIENDRLQQFEPGERYTERTSEVAKAIGKALNISPVKIEYAIKGYTGSLPIAAASLANPILRSGETGEQPEGRASEMPLIGTFFQPKDAGGLVTKAYKDMEEINTMKQTYKKMEAEGRTAEADAYLDANADTISMASLAGAFRQRMGELTKQERQVRADPSLSAKEKREMLDELKQQKIDLAKELSSVRG